MISDFCCGGFTFDANFDSGNLAKVELAKILNDGAIDKTAPDNVIDVEFNLWTKPDCAGTPYENSNRTWFFFSVTGGRPFTVAKINVMNLNKQAKLFSQGMHPVQRIGANGKWERIKDKPAYFMTAESFILTFLHKNTEDTEATTFYAFTFPYTYTEQQEQLDAYDTRFGRDTIQVETLVLEIYGKRKVSPVSSPVPVICEDLEPKGVDQKPPEPALVPSSLEKLRHNFEVKSTEELLQLPYSPIPPPVLPDPSAHPVLDENTSESVQQLTDLVNNVKIELQKKESAVEKADLRDEIYFHRELLINSYEGRRIDLLTISSFHGITIKREERIRTLFPDLITPRCNVFRDKKIVFISSRVHPGETPASFVLNGFLQFILDRKNVAAQTLRRMYVFKIVPFLNPDGVFNGLYRSDLLGHNLNRVYLSPLFDTQPSIYAVRRLIRFYHFGYDKPESNENEVAPASVPESPIKSHADILNQTIESNFTAYSGGDTCETHEDFPSFQVPAPLASFEIEDDENATDLGLFSRGSSCESSGSQKSQSFPPTVTEDELPTTPPKSAPARHSPPSKLPIARPSTGGPLRKSPPSTTVGKTSKSPPLSSSTPTRVGSGVVSLKKSPSPQLKKPALAVNNNNNNQSRVQVSPGQMTHHFRSHRNDFATLSPKNLNISLDFLTEVDESGQKFISDESSGMFLYIDLHGHASKKGIFMYGNHLPTTQEAVECMLLPRLMSLNCQHFHFDACNFSEKNMYLKGKRDGLSKEGSGRVAIYKMTGLIKSYTLESNYNTGKYINILPPKGKDSVSNKSSVVVPPKYTPAIFEEVGRALGPSILDLTGMNPNSRLLNSEFRNLQGLRNSLRADIERGGMKARSASKVLSSGATRPKSKRVEKVPQTEVSKENKGYLNYNTAGSDNAPVVPGTSSKGAGKASSSSGCVKTGAGPGPKLTRKNLGRFVKKENGGTTPPKKTKVLGETSTALKMDSRVNKDSNVPRKKIKVSPQRPEPSVDAITCFGETSIKYTSAVDSFDMCFTTAVTSTFSSSSLPSFFTQTPTLQKTSALDLDDSLDAVPCCSYSLPSTSLDPALGLRSNSFAGTAGTSGVKEFKSKFSKATSTAGGVKTKLAKVATDASKSKLLKKKRTLRADASLKRKKTRVKPVVC